MILRLEDSHRVRALTRAARAAGAPRRRRSRREPDARADRVRGTAGRLLATAIIATLGMLTAPQPVAAHLLTLAGLWLMDARISELRQRLVLDPNLAALAQLPISNATILTYQLRRRWQAAAWAGVYAAAFWAVAWSARDEPEPWMWLPAIAIAYALVTEAMALLLAARWPSLGLPLFITTGTAIWALLQSDKTSWLWSAVEPMLHVVGWLTPWGWANGVAARLPEDGRMGALLIGLSGAAAWAVVWGFGRLQRRWRMDPVWYEVAGRPRQTWNLRDAGEDDAEGSEGEPTEESKPAGTEESSSDDANVAVPAEVRATQLQQALAEARGRPSGQRMHELGWAGRQATAHLDETQRRLADRLEPHGPDTPAWRWAMLFAGLPAAAAIAGVPPVWAPLSLAVILLLLRRGWPALLVVIVLGCVFVWPMLTYAICLFAPCVIALLMTTPVLGGTWGGLPMGSTVLGGIPRTWSSLMRVMLTFTGLRLLATIPVATLVGLAMAWRVDVDLGVGIGGAWIVLALSMPWLSALRLIQRAGASADLSLGRRSLTAAGAVCVLAQFAAAITIVAGVCWAVAPHGIETSGLLLAGAAIAASLVISSLQLAMLRHAYRRRVDLLPPPA